MINNSLMGSSSIFAHIAFISVVTLEFVICVCGSSASGLKPCDFPAIFNFGDSNSDTGGLSAAFTPPPPPYGDTFFKRPSGRFSDGRLTIDFIAEGLGIPYLHAYLDAVAPNFSTGANFATAASTIVPLPDVLPLGGYSPFSLNVQYSQFIRLKNHSIIINQLGGFFKGLLPKEEFYSRALYTIDIGQNDIGAGLSESKSMQEIRDSIPMIISNFSANVKSLYEEGGRSLWIHNTGPIGCLPYTFVPFPVASSQIDSAGCAIPYNDVSQYFNQKLKEAVVQLRKDLPLAAITYVDLYSIKCGGTGEINDTKVFVGSCQDPSKRINWDGVHYTEAANKWIYDQLVNGKFSDPPISLNMACHR
ncbi:hypothetical protein Scep_002420 [Stephania cephalantha]|uniref:Uncharacterized protein n=1 Tax=Stephania cephalantha TaxID=152367 RepID=A0AAP0Q5X8_9MAGN